MSVAETAPSRTYDKVKIIILGGPLASEPDSIGPQCFVVDFINSHTDTIGKRIMIDCGTAFYGDVEADPNSYGPDLSPLLNDGKKIDLVLLTHGHGDHVGYVPALSHFNLLEEDAKIFASPQTLYISRILWQKGTEHNVPYFGVMDYFYTLYRLREIPSPPIAIDLFDGIQIYFRANGHVPGSMSITMRLPSGKNILFMGDYCWHDQASVKGGPFLQEWPPEWIPDMVLGTDCTYASTEEVEVESHERKREILVDTIIQRYEEGKKVIIPSFAYAKGPNGAIDVADRGVPCFLDGLSRRVYEEILCGYQWSDLDVTPLPIEFGSFIQRVKSTKHRCSLIESPDPCIIFTPQGMGQFGPVLDYYEYGLSREDFCFITASYLAPGTNVHKLYELSQSSSPDKTFSFKQRDGRTVTVNVKAEILRLGSSAHGLFSDLLHFLNQGVKIREKKFDLIVATHGNYSGLHRAARELSSLSARPVQVGLPGTIIEIE
jgi:metallo-beta-lactamase family protein